MIFENRNDLHARAYLCETFVPKFVEREGKKRERVSESVANPPATSVRVKSNVYIILEKKEREKTVLFSGSK